MSRKSIMIYVLLTIFIASVIYYLYSKRDYPITSYPPQDGKIVAFGDSLIRGVGSTDNQDFISQLSVKLNRPIDNFGVPGETSADGLMRVDKILAENPSIVIVLFGGNDYLKRVPIEKTFTNLEQIITKIQSSGAMVVLLGIRGGIFNDPFENRFEGLARKTGSVYVSDVLGGIFNDTRYMSDSVHPNNLGYQKIAERVYDKMKKYLR